MRVPILAMRFGCEGAIGHRDVGVTPKREALSIWLTFFYFFFFLVKILFEDPALSFVFFSLFFIRKRVGWPFFARLRFFFLNLSQLNVLRRKFV